MYGPLRHCLPSLASTINGLLATISRRVWHFSPPMAMLSEPQQVRL